MHLTPPSGLTAALLAAASQPDPPVAAEARREVRAPAEPDYDEPAHITAARGGFVATAKPTQPPKADNWPAVTEFEPRQGTRVIAGILLLAALIAAAIAGYLAWYEQSTATLGILITLFILALVIWASRASSAPTALKINSGHLTVQQVSGIRHFDLASKYTPVTVKGKPGLPGWKVIIEQREHEPFVINSAMVEPKAFMRVLRYYRPDL